MRGEERRDDGGITRSEQKESRKGKKETKREAEEGVL